jgi:hypothetical protein
MEQASAEATYEGIHKKAKWHDGSFTSWSAEWSPSHPVPLSGNYIKVGVADHDLTPWDKFTTDVEASPLPTEHPLHPTTWGRDQDESAVASENYPDHDD